MKEQKIEYRKFQNARLSDENQDWLKSERKKYGSWNKFFNELRKSYERSTKKHT